MSSLDLTLMRAVAREQFRGATLTRRGARDSYLNYLDAMCGALQQAFELWRTTALITDVMIQGPCAFGGRLSGPALDGPIRGFAPAGSWDTYSRGIAAGVHNRMRLFERLVSVPGLPLFPSFAAMPMPVAPPTPAIPTPMLSLSGGASAMMGASDLKSEIIARYPIANPMAGNDVAKAISEALNRAFVPWLTATLVTHMMGSGRVPSFAPPSVPVGPVVNGRATMTPGGLT